MSAFPVLLHRTCAFLLLLLLLDGCLQKKQSDTTRNSATNNAAGLERFQQEGKIGYRDAVGGVVIKPQFAEAGDFSWGLARVKPDAKGSWGYINGSGDEVIPPQYAAASDFVDGIAVVLRNDKFVYIGPDGSAMGTFEEDRPYKSLTVGDTLYVIHPSGLIARASGDMNAAPMGEVQPDEAVQYTYDPHQQRSQTIDGFHGRWLLVRYQGKGGYLFGVYLSRYPRAVSQQPVERYTVVGTSVKGNAYSSYILTKFASGGRLIVHDGPGWTERQEIVPEATVDQVVARLKLYPPVDIAPLVRSFNGSSETYTNETGDTVAVTVQRDTGGFMEHITMSRRNDLSTFDVSINKYGVNAVELATTFTLESADANAAESDPF
jgi:hypothetical protein